MIVLDIEASGPDNGKCGIWQIGAVNMKTKEEFLEESRIDDEDEINKEALELIEKTEKYLRDESKQSQKKLIENFLDWLSNFDERVIGGHNIGWDISFLSNKSMRYGIREKFSKIMGYRAIDIQTVAQIRFLKENGKFKKKEGKNDMHLSAVMEMCKIKDPRKRIAGGKIIKEGTPHNALEDAKLTAKCFERLLGELKNGK